MKQLLLALVALSISAFTSDNVRECKDMGRWVMEPTRGIVSLLEKNPSADSLSETGCITLLNSLKGLPDGARVVRALGSRGVENTQSRCTTTIASIQYPCTQTEPDVQRCLPEIYSYCGEWAYSATNQPKYQLAMELSTAIDAAYDKAQTLCGLAMSWDRGGTEAATKDLLAFLNDRVVTQAETFFGLSCVAREPQRSPSTRPSTQAD